MKKTLLVVVGALAVLVAATVAALRGLNTNRWEHFASRHDELVARLEADPGTREPLVGPVRPGNAWDGYRPLLESVNQKTRRAPVPLAACVTLARLREAARCDRASHPVDWTAGFDARLPRFGALQRVNEQCLFVARVNRGSGRLDAALDGVAVSLQLACDVAQVPGIICLMIALTLERPALDELRRCLQDPRATAAHRERIGRVLDGVDRQFPTTACAIEGESALMGETLRAAAEGKRTDELPPALPLLAWRKGFSSHALVAETAEHYEWSIETARRAAALDWPRAADLYADLQRRIEKSGNYLTPMLLPSAMHVDRMWRALRAQRALLRAGLLARGGPEGAWPEDPFTCRPIGRRQDGSVVRLWSAGHNGPGTGDGAWDPTDRRDIVLTIER